METKLSSLVLSNKFELFVGLLTLSSVVLALVFYIPQIQLSIDQIHAIYVFDFVVVAVMAFDFCIRAKFSKEGVKYIIRHWYEIPAMIPLIVFALFEDPLFLGAAVRSIRSLAASRAGRPRPASRPPRDGRPVAESGCRHTRCRYRGGLVG